MLQSAEKPPFTLHLADLFLHGLDFILLGLHLTAQLLDLVIQHKLELLQLLVLLLQVIDSFLLVLNRVISFLDLTTQTFNVTLQGCNDGIPLSELILQALDLRPKVTNLFLQTVNLHTYVCAYTDKIIHDRHSDDEYKESTIIVHIT